MAKKFYVSQSAIKNVISSGSEKQYICPYQYFVSYIVKTHPTKTSLAMQLGKYFESEFIGGTAHGGELVTSKDLPKKKVTKKMLRINPNAKGEPYISELRINKQVEIGKEKAKKYGLIFTEENTQIVIFKRWYKNPKIILRGELDSFPNVIKHPVLGLRLALIDIKLTANITNDYGPFCWGDFERMDNLQAVMYSYLVQDIDFDLNDELNPGNNLRQIFTDLVQKMIRENQMIFIYWVFDYKPEYADIFQPYPAMPKDYKENPHLYDKNTLCKVSELDYKQLHETIRKFVAMIEYMHKLKYIKKPTKELCSTCHVNTCEYYKMQFEQ